MSEDEKKYGKEAIDQSRFYTLSACAYKACKDINAGVERFEDFLAFAIDGARELAMDVFHEVHFTEIEMKPWKQISFPCDMVDWTKIGFRCGDTVKVFMADGNIPKVFDKENCVPQPHKPSKSISELVATDVIMPFFGTQDYFSPTGSHFYGLLADYNYAGYFDVNWKDRVFNFKSVVNNVNKVYLEYITDGINYNGQTVIHPYVYRAIVLFIHWQRKEHDDRYSESAKERAKRLFEDKVDDVLVRFLNLSIEDVKDALRMGIKQTVKG